MQADAAQLERLLTGSILGGRTVERLTIPGCDDLALCITCGPAEVLEGWTAAHAVVGESMRWPVVAAGWGGNLDDQVFSRFPFDHGAGDDVSVSGIVERAARLETAEVVSNLALRDAAWDGYEHLEVFELASTQRLVGRAPQEQEVRDALGSVATHAEVDRHLLEWEERVGASGEISDAHLDWFEPVGLAVAVVFLPTPNSWETPAYISFFGAEGPGGAENLIVMLRSWSERFGAELVAHYGTMLEFLVRRPPSALDEAWQLAYEQELVAQCTTILPGVALRDHARCLVGRDRWFLHERP